MDDIWGWLAGGALLLVCVALGVLPGWKRRRRQDLLEGHQREFHRQREHLEARFLKLASESGKPRGLAWSNCDFENDVVYARERRSGDLRAFVACTISFEAIEGGGMEEVEAVSNLRAATAVFRVDQGRWTTDGRAIFNLNPVEAVRHCQQEVELVAQEASRRV